MVDYSDISLIAFIIILIVMSAIVLARRVKASRKPRILPITLAERLDPNRDYLTRRGNHHGRGR